VEDDTENVIVCLTIDLCGVCGGDGSSCAGCDGVVNSGLVDGVDCPTGEIVCDGTPPDECPVPVVAVVTASVVGGAVSGAALVALTGAAGLFLLGLFRRGHFQQNVLSAYELCIEEQLGAMNINPLAVDAQVCFEVPDLMQDLDLINDC